MKKALAKLISGDSAIDVVRDHRAKSSAEGEHHSHQVPNVGLGFAAARTRSETSKPTSARVQDYGDAVPRQPVVPARLGGSR